MKKGAFFLLGVAVGLVACFLTLYLSGTVLEYFGMRMYENESDQQRNFNLFLLVSAVLSLCSGLLFARKFA